mgnify:CR=1 FL=1
MQSQFLDKLDLERELAFYTSVLGLHVADRSDRIAFLSAQPRDQEHHELVLSLGRTPDQTSTVSQVSFHAPTLQDVRDFHAFLSKNAHQVDAMSAAVQFREHLVSVRGLRATVDGASVGSDAAALRDAPARARLLRRTPRATRRASRRASRRRRRRRLPAPHSLSADRR